MPNAQLKAWPVSHVYSDDYQRQGEMAAIAASVIFSGIDIKTS
jgi:hypothetical protein